MRHLFCNEKGCAKSAALLGGLEENLYLFDTRKHILLLYCYRVYFFVSIF
jgi:hypothetical protein